MHFLTRSEQETRTLGRCLAAHLSAGDIICLYGDLGSGKTVLTKGICAGVGVETRAVTSPTFVLMNRYAGRIPVFHFDLYRLDDPLELAAIGYEEFIFDDGVSVVEWADKLGCLLPPEHLRIELRMQTAAHRSITMGAHGKRYQLLMEKIHEDPRLRHLK